MTCKKFPARSAIPVCLTLIASVSSLEAGEARHAKSNTALADLILVDLNGFVADEGAANRIVAGDMLRSLSQEIPAAVCHLHNNIDVAEAAEVLAYSIDAFDTITDALLYGNEEIGIIGEETRRKTIVQLQDLKAAWDPIHIAAQTVLDTPADSEATRTVYESTNSMMDQTYRLLVEIEGEYSNPTEILQTDLMLLEVSGRMAAFNQRLAYEACRVWSHDSNEEMVEDLLKTMSYYESSLEALTLGMPSMGIQPPPTEEIANKLAEIGDHWSEVHDQLVFIAEGNEFPVADREALYHDLIIKLHQIEELEVLYQDHSKRIF